MANDTLLKHNTKTQMTKVTYLKKKTKILTHHTKNKIFKKNTRYENKILKSPH